MLADLLLAGIVVLCKVLPVLLVLALAVVGISLISFK